MRFNTLIKRIRKETEPNPDFAHHAKERYLALYEAVFPAKNSPWKVYLMRAASVAAACMVVLGTASVYADQSNVGVQSPLYPLKRVSESVRFAVSSDEKKQELQTELAVRRVEEVEKGGSGGVAMEANAELKQSLKSLPVRELSVPDTALRLEQGATLFVAPAEESPSPTPTASSTPDSESALLPPGTPEATPTEEPDGESEIEIDVEIEEEFEKAPCGAIKRAKEKTDVWLKIGDTELEELFEERCE